jgi:hypothetical protein
MEQYDRPLGGPDQDDSDNPTEAAPDMANDPVIEMPGPPEGGEGTGAAWTGGAPGEEQGASGSGQTAGESETGSGGGEASSRRRMDPQEMVAQLQRMIDQLATTASPTMREVAAKAAELAAGAAQRTGPIAHRAATATESVAERVAQRGRQVAADLRGSAGSTAAGEAMPAAEPAPGADGDTSDMAGGSVEDRPPS